MKKITLRIVRACALLGLVLSLQLHFIFAESGSPNLPNGFISKTFSDEIGEYRYVVFVPEGYSADKKWPVVLFLHGAGEKGADGIKPISVGLGTALCSTPNQKFIAVFPQSENRRGRHLTGWLAKTVDAQRAARILDQVETEYSIDPNRRVLCGWSMGGYGAWSQASENPDHWAGVLAISGGRVDETLSLTKLAKSQIPVWAIHGNQDALIPFEQSTQLVHSLNELGGNGTVTIVDGIGHDIWRYVFADQRVMDWLAEPEAIDPAKVDQLASNSLLPRRSQFYLDQYTQLEVLPNMISLRMGNNALEVISQGIPDVIPVTALQGQLDDIERTFGTSKESINVKISGVQFECNVAETRLEAISGGRFRTQFALNPLRLKIDSTSLSAGEITASTGRFQIDIGHRRPVVLEVEIQPKVGANGFELVPLRQRFSIADNNWYITPPTDVSVSGATYTKANIITGIVGGLYLQKADVEEAVLGVVPSLLKVVEEELRSREAPKLAKLLWPFPALVPEISISPRQVRTDTQGISLAFDMHVRTSKLDVANQLVSSPPITPGNFDVRNMPASRNLDFGVSLNAIEALGRFAIRDGLAYLNVLDLPDEHLVSLTEPEVLSRVFPDVVDSNSDEIWNVGLRLTDPFTIRAAQQNSPPGQVLIELDVPSVVFEVSSNETSSEATLRFSLKQILRIETIESHGIPQSFAVTWLPDPTVRVHSNSAVTTVHGDEFEELFTQSWTEWSQSQSGTQQSIPRMQFGSAALSLKTFRVQDDVAELTFAPSKTDVSQQVSTTDASD